MKNNRIIISANEATKNNSITLAIDLFQEVLKESLLSFDLSFKLGNLENK